MSVRVRVAFIYAQNPHSCNMSQSSPTYVDARCGMGVRQPLHARSEKVMSYAYERIATVMFLCELQYCNTRISRFFNDDAKDAPPRGAAA